MQAEQRSIDDGVAGAPGRVLVAGLLLVAAVAVAVLLGLTSRHPRLAADAVSYSLSANGTHLSVVVQHGSCDDDLRVTVTETPQRVTLLASVRSLAQVCDSALHSTTVDVGLQEPLGAREVVDGAHEDRVLTRTAS